jgi:hypothetical protein
MLISESRTFTLSSYTKSSVSEFEPTSFDSELRSRLNTEYVIVVTSFQHQEMLSADPMSNIYCKFSIISAIFLSYHLRYVKFTQRKTSRYRSLPLQHLPNNHFDISASNLSNIGKTKSNFQQQSISLFSSREFLDLLFLSLLALCGVPDPGLLQKFLIHEIQQGPAVLAGFAGEVSWSFGGVRVAAF